MTMDWNSSYAIGNDHQSGWGWRYFFTFYTEIYREDDPVGGGDFSRTAVDVATLVFILVASLISNGGIAYAVLKYPEMRTTSNCFLLNLSAADILFALGIPALIYARLTPEWPLGNLVCKLLPYSQFTCCFVLLWTLTWISMDRHRCIVVPPYRSTLTPRRATVLTLLTWLVALLLYLPVVFIFREQKVNVGPDERMVCTMVFPRHRSVSLSALFVVPIVTLTCIVPLSAFVFHYQRIFKKVNELRERWKQCKVEKHKTDAANRTACIAEQAGRRFDRHVRVVRILLANVMIVLLMWLPITVVSFLIYIDGQRPNEDTGYFLRAQHFLWALHMALLNTVVNPLLYGLLSENFRKCFARMWFLSQRRKTDNRSLDRQFSPGSGGTKAQSFPTLQGIYQTSSASFT